MSASLSVTGFAEIDRVLKGMPDQLTHQVLSSAHSDAAKPLIILAKSTVRKKSGNLSNSIGVKKTTLSKTNILGLVQVGPLRGSGKKGYHGHLIEYGHKIRSKGGKLFGSALGKILGFVRPYPFMQPSFNSTKNTIEQGIAESLSKVLLRYMNRTIKKYA